MKNILSSFHTFVHISLSIHILIYIYGFGKHNLYCIQGIHTTSIHAFTGGQNYDLHALLFELQEWCAAIDRNVGKMFLIYVRLVYLWSIYIVNLESFEIDCSGLKKPFEYQAYHKYIWATSQMHLGKYCI